MAHLGEIGEVKEISRIGTEQLLVEWRIRNVLSLPSGLQDCYVSPEFRVDDECWLLELYPNWRDESRNPASGWMWLVLVRFKGRTPKIFHFSVGIKVSGGVEKRREGKKEFSFIDFSYGYYLCLRSELMEHKTRLMPHGVLNITCNIKRVVTGSAGSVFSLPSSQEALPNRSQTSDKQDTSTQTDCNLEAEVVTGVKGSSEKRGCEKALEDFALLLASGDKSDVTVQVGDVDFKVHKLILSARCPALSVSFEHESKEKASNRIIIEDCKPDIFQEFLHHLYTGSVQSLTEQTVFGLYRIADKYLVNDLKQHCLEHIEDTLSVQTFCDSMKLALMYGESSLLQKAIDFAARNIRLVVLSVEWQNFIREYPTEANEIFIKSLDPPCENQYLKS